MTVLRSQPIIGHTPTPWRKTLSPMKGRLCIVSGPDDSYTWICGDLHNDILTMPSAEAEANATLIVEAVNSHAALVKALEEIVGLDDCRWIGAAQKIARAALSDGSAKT